MTICKPMFHWNKMLWVNNFQTAFCGLDYAAVFQQTDFLWYFPSLHIFLSHYQDCPSSTTAMGSLTELAYLLCMATIHLLIGISYLVNNNLFKRDLLGIGNKKGRFLLQYMFAKRYNKAQIILNWWLP